MSPDGTHDSHQGQEAPSYWSRERRNGLFQWDAAISYGICHTEPRVFKTKYRYHCQDAAGNPLFRYDNAPHHHTETFPNHKHTFSSSAGEIIIAADPPTIETLLDEIASFEAQG